MKNELRMKSYLLNLMYRYTEPEKTINKKAIHNPATTPMLTPKLKGSFSSLSDLLIYFNAKINKDVKR